MNHLQLPKRFIWLAIAVLLLSLIGYLGYVVYPRFSLPAVGTGFIVLAVMAGLASLFSPCSFPLLLTILSREASSNGRLIRASVAFTVGMALFLLLTGVALSLGAGQWISAVTFTSTSGRLLRLGVGVVLISFGFWQVQGKSLTFSWLNRALAPLWNKQAQLRRQRSTISYGLYGFGYTLAGFG